MTLFTAVLLLCLCVGILAACNGKKGGSVTFIADGKEQVVDISGDGSVTAPTVSKEYYNFMGWYTDENYETRYDEKAAKDGDKVYAYFVSIKLNLHLNGANEGEKELKDLTTLTAQYEKAAQDKSLTFDGWYVDAGYTTKYTTQDADDLYGREMVQVTFDNGYETVYTELVQVNTAMAKPKAETVKKYYMDEEDISFVTETGADFDFTKEIVTNTTIKVLWKTPGLVYSNISGSNYQLLGISRNMDLDDIRAFPVISILSKNVTVDDQGTKGNIVVVNGTASGAYGINITNAYKIIINEGVKYLNSFNGMTQLEEVELPSSLKIIEESFWSLTSLKSLTIPNGVEVIIDCFWKQYNNNQHNLYRGETNYDFDIVIPASVKDLALVPYNVSFAQGSPYVKENNRIYKIVGNEKILVSDYHSNVVDGTLTVPDGVTAIQVGALEVGCVNDVGYDYLSIPSSVTKVVYHEDIQDDAYKAFYTGKLLTDVDKVTAPDASADPRSYAIVRSLDKVQYVMFDATAYPFESTYALVGAKDGNKAYTNFDNVVFVGEVSEGDITVTVISENTMGNGSVVKYSYAVAVGTELTQENVLTEAGITSAALGMDIKITAITQFGKSYVFGEKNANQYIDVKYEYSATGFTYEENADGTLTVTGLDETTAQNLGTEENPGPYLVIVPNSLNGKTIVAIKDGAFKNNQKLARIYISNSVKKIGAEAFKNTSNLEYVNIAAGGLEEIGKSAFEYAGAVLSEGEYVINPNLTTTIQAHYNDHTGTKSMIIYVPLANLKKDLVDANGNYWSAIGEYAFRTPAIVGFQPVDGEDTRTALVTTAMDENYNMTSSELEGLEPGMFFWKKTSYGAYLGIYRYVSKTTEVKPEKSDGSGEYEVTVYDVQYIATAGGYSNNSDPLYLGYTMRKYTQYWDSSNAMYATMCGYVYRYEVMEGSIYFLKLNRWLGVVSKVHTNAFTDMSGESVNLYSDQDNWLTEEQVKTQDAAIFEEGWWEGRANSENDFLKTLVVSDPLFT